MVRLLTLVLATAAPVPSVPPPLPADYELRWSAPAECPTDVGIRERIAALRGASPGGEGTALVVGEVIASADGYALTLTTTFAAGTHVRRLHAAQCAELGESAALVVAVALRRGIEAAMTPADGPLPTLDPPMLAEPTPPLEPSAPSSSTTSADASGPSSDVLAEAPSSFDEPPPVTDPRPPPGEPIARIEGLGEIGALGVITGGARLVLGLAWHRARVELSGLYLAPRRRRIDDGRGAWFQGGAVAVRGCWVPHTRTLALPLCAGVEAGTVRADNRRITPRMTLHTPWAGPTLGVGLVRALGPVRLWIGIDAVVRVVGRRFRIDGDVVFEQWPVSLRWSLGLEIPLGRRARTTKSTAPGRAGAKNRAEADTMDPTRAR